MAWTSMHFAVGMGCAGAAFAAGSYFLRRGHRWLPAAMTVGGIWACVPDFPRFFREDFPQVPLAGTFGSKTLERSLHAVGDLFGFHRALDAQPHEFALHGLFCIVLLYNLAIGYLLTLESRQRNSLANRTWRAHGGDVAEEALSTRRKRRRQSRRRRSQESGDVPEPAYLTEGEPPPSEKDGDVIYRIQPTRNAEGS